MPGPRLLCPGRLRRGKGDFVSPLGLGLVGVCEFGLLWTPKASRGRRRRVLDAQGGARVAAGTGGMCRAAAGANGLGFVGLDLGFRVRGASPVSRGCRHVCARCGSTRELGVPCCISIWALGFASHRTHAFIVFVVVRFSGPLLLCRPAGLPGRPWVSVCKLPGSLSGVVVGRCSIVYELPRAGP